MTVLLVRRDLFLETMERFSNQAGTRLSFADATIMGVARSRADGLILSFDEEFRKVAGLVSTLNKLTGRPARGGGSRIFIYFCGVVATTLRDGPRTHNSESAVRF